LSTPPIREDRPSELVAGFLASFAIFASLVGLVRRPVPVTTAAILVSIVAAGIGGRHARLAALAVAVSSACFVLGLVIAIVTGNSIF
jgi:hypothetical protein